MRELDGGLEQKCPFCREPNPKTNEEGTQNVMERAKANDPNALFYMGSICDDEGDYEGAVKYYTKAAKLGNMDAHYNLSLFYEKGRGVEQDPKKEVYHLEEAAIGGHHIARFNLGLHEGRNGRRDRAYRHLIIAADLGYDDALDKVKEGFVHGLVSKEDYESALRGHQAAVDATKSEQREEAYAFYTVYDRSTEGGSNHVKYIK
jgi:TPR repeat protein